METRSNDALRERVARLEVLVGGPANGSDNPHPVFYQLETLADQVERVADAPESSIVLDNGMAETVEHLKAGLEEIRSDVALLVQAVLSQPQQHVVAS